MKVLRDVKKLKIYMFYVPKKIKMQGKMIKNKMTVREREMYIWLLNGEVVARAKRTTGFNKVLKKETFENIIKTLYIIIKII